MRLAVLVALAAVLAACSSSTRTVPRSAIGLHARYGHELSATPEGQEVLAFARAQVGRRYCWGGTGPSCFDCSGLVQRAWSTVGVRLPRTSGAMGEALPDVLVDDIRPGDILWYPGHVALYAGEGRAIEALDSHDGVVERVAKDPYRVLRPPGG
ncbi:MAG TPA: C40 family peptidase [Polyangiaceae bacterium]